MNPQPNREVPAGEGNALVMRPQDLSYQELSDIINRVQRHKCTEVYCLRRRRMPSGRLTDNKVCRFYFPRQLHEMAIVTNDLNPVHLIFDGARNDTRLNNFNRLIALAWRANRDISPCTSQHAVINYIAKYASKAETKSESYRDIARAILPKVNSNKPLVSFVAKFMNKLASERDWSAQEVCHLLLRLPLQQCTRTLVTVDCRPPATQLQTEVINEQGVL